MKAGSHLPKVSLKRIPTPDPFSILAASYETRKCRWTQLSRAGYRPSSLELSRSIPREFDFYLEHGLKEKEYVKEWRLFIPKWL